ncbi:MAG TPA: dihydropteroate synthase [Vicinamibacterales bacterium]|nr:dihydropteroate synthase [Vicinamibacterales bacterium]
MISRRHYDLPLPGGRRLVLGPRTLVMGVLNVTPDSFAEAVPRLDPVQAAADAHRMEAEGADLIDIGGESTRPGAGPVTVEEELARVMPVIDRLRGRIGVPLAIDTSKAAVARAALDAGVAIVNDVSGLRADPALAGVVAAHGAALVLMHSRGTPRDMHHEARYESLLDEVAAELRAAMARAVEAGVPAAQLILDPGIGFAKRPAHSYGVLAGLSALTPLDRPLLVGPSRKSFLCTAIGDVPAPERDWATAAAVTAAVLEGAHIVRVHAVHAMGQVVRVADELRRHADASAWTG